jgi:hypothetical protein
MSDTPPRPVGCGLHSIVSLALPGASQLGNVPPIAVAGIYVSAQGAFVRRSREGVGVGRCKGGRSGGEKGASPGCNLQERTTLLIAIYEHTQLRLVEADIPSCIHLANLVGVDIPFQSRHSFSRAYIHTLMTCIEECIFLRDGSILIDHSKKSRVILLESTFTWL